MNPTIFLRIVAALYLLASSIGVSSAAPGGINGKIVQASTLNGTVVDEAGKPIASISFTASSTAWLSPNNAIPAATSGLDGSFSLNQVPYGTYYLNVGRDWTVKSPATFSVPSASPITFVLDRSPTANLSGTVVDTHGDPIPGVQISYTLTHVLWPNHDMSDQVQVTTDNKGTYVVSDAPCDTNLILRSSVTKPGYQYINGGDLSVNGSTLAVSPIVLAELNTTVSGVVLNGLGKPVAGAWVCCPQGGSSTVNPIVQTDAKGAFTITGLVAGPVDIFADKGRYVGHLLTQASPSPSTTVQAVSLSPTPLASPAPEDIPAASSLFSKLIADVPPSLSSQIQWLRDECAKQIAAASPIAALHFLGNYSAIKTSDLQWLTPENTTPNPQGTVAWESSLLQRTDDDGSAGEVAVDLGLDIAPYDLAEAAKLYGIASKKIAVDNVDNDESAGVMKLDALAYALDRPEADDIYQKILAGLAARAARDNTDSTEPSSANWEYGCFVETLARTNLKLALTMLPNVLPIYNPQVIDYIIADLLRTNPSEALSVFHTLDAVKTAQNSRYTYDYNLSLLMPVICRNNTTAALAMVPTSLFDPDVAEVLTNYADELPLAQALPVYTTALSKAIGDWDSGSPDGIAAHVYLRDKSAGALLFKKAFIMTINPSSVTPNSITFPKSLTRFAFYYSRYDPGYSRVLLECLYYQAQHSGSNFDGGNQTKSVIAAMASIDPVRAETMASSVQDATIQFNAMMRVGEYLMMSQHSRDTLNFVDWSSSDWWVASKPVPW